MKLLVVLALCGAALSEVFFEEKFDTLDAWVQSTHKGAEAGKSSTCMKSVMSVTPSLTCFPPQASSS